MAAEASAARAWPAGTMPDAGAKMEIIEKRWSKLRQVLYAALLSFFAEDSLMVAGSIAYHSLLAIFPLLLLLLGVSGLYIRHYELTGHLSVVLQRYLPVRTDIIMQNLVSISHAYGRIGVASFLLLLWSSSGVFLPLETSLNRAWEVGPGRPWWRSRLLALEMAFVVGCLLLVSTVSVGLEIVIRRRLDILLGPTLQFLVVLLYHLLTAVSSFSIALLAFVIIFQRLPNRPIGFRQAFPGALLTAILWELARIGFAFLLRFFNYRHVYGSIGVVVSFMTWAYITSGVVLFGAQISRNLYGTLKYPEFTHEKGIPLSSLKSLGR
jgi:membrane protein